MDLPAFRYHPDPLASGSIVRSENACICCRQQRGFIYAGPAYSERELDDALCPWCIADGSAHRAFDASFADPAGFADEIGREVVEEIAFRTPGFAAWQQERWLACCGDAAAFLEAVGHAELKQRYAQLEGALMMHIVHDLEISGAAAVRLLQSLDRDRGPTAYVFACRHCDNKPAYIDFVGSARPMKRSRKNMRWILFGGLAAAAALAAVLLVFMRVWTARTVALDVEFRLTDQNNQPLPGVPVRLVFGGKDWQAPDAGMRIVTAADGSARFTTPASVARGWTFVNIGFTGLSMPVRADHLPVALELAFVVPQRNGPDMTHRWLYTADIDRLPDGDCTTDDLDKVYDLGTGGAFTKLVGRNAAGPNFDALVDGWRLDAAGYKLSDFMLRAPSAGSPDAPWHLKLGLMRKPKPVIVQ